MTATRRSKATFRLGAGTRAPTRSLAPLLNQAKVRTVWLVLAQSGCSHNAPKQSALRHLDHGVAVGLPRLGGAVRDPHWRKPAAALCRGPVRGARTINSKKSLLKLAVFVLALLVTGLIGGLIGHAARGGNASNNSPSASPRRRRRRHHLPAPPSAPPSPPPPPAPPSPPPPPAIPEPPPPPGVDSSPPPPPQRASPPPLPSDVSAKLWAPGAASPLYSSGRARCGTHRTASRSSAPCLIRPTSRSPPSPARMIIRSPRRAA